MCDGHGSLVDDLLSVRWHLRYSLSYRDWEEILAERGLGPDHTMAYRWVRKFTPELVKKFHRRKVPVGGRWRLNETYIGVNGQWRYLYRAVDKRGRTVDFLLTAHRNRAAALRLWCEPSGLNAFNAASYAAPLGIESRRCKYLNNVVEQDHRFIKKRTRAMVGFKTFNSARVVLGGIELLHMIRNGQLAPRGLGKPKTEAEQFYQLAA